MNVTSHGSRRVADPLATHSFLQLFEEFEEKKKRDSRISKALIKKRTKYLSGDCNLKSTSKDPYNSTMRRTSVVWQGGATAATLTRDFKELTTAEQVMQLCGEMAAMQPLQPVPEFRGNPHEKSYSDIGLSHFVRKHPLW